MFSGAFSRGSEPTQVTTMSGAIDGEDNVVSNATLAWLQSGRAGLRWKQPLQPQDDILKQLESDGDLIRSSASEKDRIVSATRLGMACRSADPAVVAAATGILLTSLRSGKECEQRAAAYGLSVGGDAVISPLLDIVRDLLFEDLSWLQTTPHHEMTRDKGTGADYTWHIMVNAVFALGSFLRRVLHRWVASYYLFSGFAHLDLPSGESLQTPSAGQLDVLHQVIQQAIRGIQDYLQGWKADDLAEAEAGGANRGFYLCTHQVDFFVTQRRRAIASALTAIGFVGHNAVV